ncbi:hypothetical protein [Faecalimicrobium sp. JNUCC 81]
MSILEAAEELKVRAEDLRKENKNMSLYEAYLIAAREINSKGD